MTYSTDRVARTHSFAPDRKIGGGGRVLQYAIDAWGVQVGLGRLVLFMILEV